MNARSVARETIILAMSQIRISTNELENTEIEEFIEQAIRALNNEVEDNLKEAKGELVLADDAIMEAKINADNMEKVKNYVTNCIESAQKAIELLAYCNKWPLMCLLANKNDVKNQIVKILKLYRKNQKNIDEIISKSVINWTLESMYSVDRNIIRVAVTEMVYDEVPHKIAIDEAIEMAKKYGSEESSGFVNGVLRRILDTIGLEIETTESK